MHKSMDTAGVEEKISSRTLDANTLMEQMQLACKMQKGRKTVEDVEPSCLSARQEDGQASSTCTVNKSQRGITIVGDAIKLTQAASVWASSPSSIDVSRHLQQPQPLRPSSPWPPLAVPWHRPSSVAEGWWQGLGACESETQDCSSPSSSATTMERRACEATRCPASSAWASSALGTRAPAFCRARS
jgi:hypothetical protein